MDDSRFDALSRALGGAVSRRSGLVALGALLGGVAIGDATAASGRKRPKPEGPCGDGSRKDNICTKGDDCCTGSCDLSKGKTNKDGLGRCRCVRKGGSCTEDKNCCGGRICGGGSVCGGPVTPVGSPCVVGVDRCADGATCQQLSTSLQNIIQDTGYYCAHDTGEECGNAPQFPTTTCYGGFCSPNGPVCGNVYIPQGGCTSETDSCTGNDVYLVFPVGLCAMSVGGLPVMIVPGSSVGSCAADTECGQSDVCADIPQGSQCTALNLPAGSSCVPGAYACTQTSDCPVKPSLTPSCSSGLCQYAT